MRRLAERIEAATRDTALPRRIPARGTPWRTGWLVPLLFLQCLTASPRIVAIGDVHGDLNHFTQLLARTGLVDESATWAGGDDILVQTGDLVDRGPFDRQVLELMMRLEKEADRAGGRVVALLGNHEVMNLIGDLRYVNPEVYRAFADRRSEKRRTRAWKQYERFQQRRAARLETFDPPAPLTETEWMEAHPLGYLEHREAFSARGRYGKWLRRRAVVAEIDGQLFLHGGLSEVLPDSLEAINQRVQEELHQFDDLRRYLVTKEIILPFFDLNEVQAEAYAELASLDAQMAAATADPLDEATQLHRKILEAFLYMSRWLISHPRGPLWDRSLAEQPEVPAEQTRIEGLLARYGARLVVVGHTTQLEGIRTRFDGRVILIDTGMLSPAFAGGTPSALEISGSGMRAIYLDREPVVLAER